MTGSNKRHVGNTISSFHDEPQKLLPSASKLHATVFVLLANKSGTRLQLPLPVA
jgi:hypothetical protein